MESTWTTIVAAIITAIISPVITIIITKRISQKKYPTSEPERDERLIDSWEGFFEQESRDDKNKVFKTPITVNLKKTGRIIRGSVNFHLEDEIITLNLYQGKFDGNLLKIDYVNSKNYVIQFGTIITKLNNKGNTLEGKYLGIAPTRDEIISGKIIAHKK